MQLRHLCGRPSCWCSTRSALLLLSALLPGFELDGAGAALGHRGRGRPAERARVAAARALHAAAERAHARPGRARAQRRAGGPRDRPDPRAPRSTTGARHRGRARADGADRLAVRAAGDRRGRVLVPQRRPPPGAPPRRADRERRAGRALPRDRRAGPRRPATRDARRQRAHARRAGCARARTGSRAGRRTGRRRRAPARRGCCTATTTTCRRSAGGRRTAARRS